MQNLKKAYYDYIKSDVYSNYLRNKLIFEGKSTDVFYSDVLRRVKLEYMGVLTADNHYAEFSRVGNKMVRDYKPFKTLVVPHGILAAVTRVYTELGTNSEPILSVENENAEEFFKEIDLQEKLEEIMSVQSSHGKCLLRCGIEENELDITVIEVNQYFRFGKNYAIFSRVDKTKISFEIHSLNKVEYKLFEEVAGDLKEINYEDDLTVYGAIKEGLGYKLLHKGIQVVEVRNIFGRSDYTEDLIKINRELVIGETLTSQAFDKVANPLLQIPDGAVEYDDNGDLTVKLQDRTIIVEAEDKEVKQVQLETKTAEWNLHRQNLIEQVYQQTGTNEQVFGLNKNGSSASGEAKRRDLERAISTVLSKRDKALVGLEKMFKWGYRKVFGKEIELLLTGKDILSLSFLEKIDIVSKGILSGVMSMETAIKFLNMTNSSYEDEIQKIKKEPKNLKALIDNLVSLNNIVTDERLSNYVKTMVNELVEELEL